MVMYYFAKKVGGGGKPPPFPVPTHMNKFEKKNYRIKIDVNLLDEMSNIFVSSDLASDCWHIYQTLI